MTEGNEGPQPADDDLSGNEFDSVISLLSEITDADRQRLEPPPSVWTAIADTVSADRDGHPDRTLTFTDNGDGSVVAEISPIEHQASTTISLAARHHPSDEPALPSEMSAWRRQWLPVAAAVAVAVVGGLATWAFSDELPRAASERGAGDQVDEFVGEPIATVEITDEGLTETAGQAGEARLIEAGGRHYIELDVPNLPDSGGYHELWIADPDVTSVFSLGVVTDGGRYALPDNIDPAQYPVVDVSVEAIDGDPTHSGRSVLRGRLDL